MSAAKDETMREVIHGAIDRARERMPGPGTLHCWIFDWYTGTDVVDSDDHPTVAASEDVWSATAQDVVHRQGLKIEVASLVDMAALLVPPEGYASHGEDRREDRSAKATMAAYAVMDGLGLHAKVKLHLDVTHDAPCRPCIIVCMKEAK